MKNLTMAMLTVYMAVHIFLAVEGNFGRQCWTNTTNGEVTVTCSMRGEPK